MLKKEGYIIKRILISLISISLIALIFFLSSEGVRESSKKSDLLVNFLVTHFGFENSISFRLLVRKIIGHFLIFMLLGLFLGLMALNYKKIGSILLVILPIGLIISLISEGIQITTENRNASIKDVLLNFCGFTIGLLLILLYRLMKNKTRSRKSV